MVYPFVFTYQDLFFPQNPVETTQPPPNLP